MAMPRTLCAFSRQAGRSRNICERRSPLPVEGRDSAAPNLKTAAHFWATSLILARQLRHEAALATILAAERTLGALGDGLLHRRFPGRRLPRGGVLLRLFLLRLDRNVIREGFELQAGLSGFFRLDGHFDRAALAKLAEQHFL